MKLVAFGGKGIEMLIKRHTTTAELKVVDEEMRR